MGHQVEDIMERIRAGGGRVTTSRRMVVEELLAREDHHVTAPELIDALRAVDPEVHESTVYRVLERLTELQVVEQVHVQAGVTVFHVTSGAHGHHHLVCTSCGAVTETGRELLDEAAARALDRHGFAVHVDSPATLHGRCAACRAADPG